MIRPLGYAGGVGLWLLVLGGLLVAPPALSQQTVGLFLNDAPEEGLTLFTPRASTESYLISNDGLLVNSWSSTYRPGFTGYLTDGGDLVRSARVTTVAARWVGAAGRGGRLEQYDWDGNLVWEFDYFGVLFLPHHDIELLPNGNVLLSAWEVVSGPDAIAAGMNPVFINEEVWFDYIIEVEPTPPVGGNIVWEWHSFDHLVQDFDVTKANFGVVADHPELVDVNGIGLIRDWAHLNAIDYHPGFDQIMLSAHSFDEIWVIDHGTTTAEAAGHTGGSFGKGGDLLYRWGNPVVYDRGVPTDRRLYGQHDAQWIPPGRPGAGNILVHNNGTERPEGQYSSVDELVPPVDGGGNYSIGVGVAYGPAAAIWSYVATPPTSFFSAGMSGAERLPDGNTLICEAITGRFFEVEPNMSTTWEYVNPVDNSGVLAQGTPPNNNAVFKIRRYPLDFPGFVGRDLTPGDPIETFSSPLPAPADSLRAGKTVPDGSTLDVEWDAFQCPSFDYNLIYGSLQNVSTYILDGADCAIGLSGVHQWTAVPAGSLFFLVVGTNDSALYESSWGRDSGNEERFGTKASFTCGSTTKVVGPTCP